jgi:hypothetical protein
MKFMAELKRRNVFRMAGRPVLAKGSDGRTIRLQFETHAGDNPRP